MRDLITNYRKSGVILAAGLLFATALFAAEDDWPRFRGSNMDATATGILKVDEGQGLKISWKKPLGSGYSSISVMDGRAVTMFSDSTYDYIIALDADTGKELWRFKIDSTYIGHDGSHNGPISTPVISRDRVYALGPKGHLIALDIQSGEKVWSRHIVEDLKALAPVYGFATSPVLDGDVLIVETGGEGSTISGLNKDTGEVLWSTGNDTVNYQSPITINLGGEVQLLCIGDKYLYGLAPGTGELLWEYRHDGGSGSINPVVVGKNKIFLQYKWSESVMLEITKEDSQYIAEELWKTKNIKGTYNTPVYHDGHLYGYSSRFLTCVDVETGNSVWKSRQPGDGFVIMVDGKLVIVTKKGGIYVAKASPDGYVQLAGLQAFESLAWTPASFANGRIFARSLTEIASIEIAKIDQLVTAAEEVVAPDSQFMNFIRKVTAAENKTALIDEFMASQEAFPIVEGDDLVHFIYRGEGDDVVLQGDMIGFRQDQSMRRVEATDLFYHTARLLPDARVGYRFAIDFEKISTDSLNADRNQAGVFGTSSWVSMPEWVAPKHLEPYGNETPGRVDSLRFDSKITELNRKLDIYLPAGYDESDMKYPVAYIHGGALALNFGQQPNSLNNLIGESVAPLIAVFIHQKPNSRGEELTGDLKEKYAQMVAEEIVPLIDKKYRTVRSSEARASIGAGFSGFMAFYSTWKHPGVFGKVASQSTFLLTEAENELKSLKPDAGNQPLEIYLDWGTYDIRSPLEGWDNGRENSRFSDYLTEKGFTVAGGEVHDGFGWGSWRNRTDKVFERFFPMEKAQKMN
ncbi:PQQ-binding-like beta-propeller repeat protein [candidate division KSB1 bacterium]|nr:PQQ-binding-like beta-propeller repeat protein [candidate division KSB1 bacterium]